MKLTHQIRRERPIVTFYILSCIFVEKSLHGRAEAEVDRAGHSYPKQARPHRDGIDANGPHRAGDQHAAKRYFTDEIDIVVGGFAQNDESQHVKTDQQSKAHHLPVRGMKNVVPASRPHFVPHPADKC